MDDILEGLRQTEGVMGVTVLGAGGQLLAHAVSTVYDAGVFEQIGKSVAAALDSLQLAQEQWDSITANFADGKLVVQNLSPSGAPTPSGARALVVIADGRTNLTFVTVAIRVAAMKLKTAPAIAMRISAPAAQVARGLASSRPAIGAPVVTNSIPNLSQSSSLIPEMSSTGLSWSGGSGSTPMGGSGVSVADPASSAFLTVCTKAYARCVGPMAKSLVKQAIRRLWPDRPFSLSLASALIQELEGRITDPEDRAEFRKAARSGY